MEQPRNSPNSMNGASCFSCGLEQSTKDGVFPEKTAAYVEESSIALGDIIGPAQRVDVMTAIKSMTIWPAWQHFEENEKGTIEVGKLANFVVLDKNPLTIDPEELDTIRVAETIKEGVVVYSMPPGESLNGNMPAPSSINVLVAMNASGSAMARRGVISSTLGQSRNAPLCTTCVCGALSQIADVIATGKRQ